MAIVFCSFLYLLVFLVDEETGWIDHYHIRTLTEYMPLWAFILVIYLLTFVTAYLLRIGHNAIHRKRKEVMKTYYQELAFSDHPAIKDAIISSAKHERENDINGELIVPRRIFAMMEEKYQSGSSMDELCKICIDA